jgi:hypothetical protein
VRQTELARLEAELFALWNLGDNVLLAWTAADGGRYLVNRYHLRDKHGTTRAVYNAKINIHRAEAEPIFLGMRSGDLPAFDAVNVELLNLQRADAG